MFADNDTCVAQLDIHARLLCAVAGVLFWHASWSTLRLHVFFSRSERIKVAEAPGDLSLNGQDPREVREFKVQIQKLRFR